MKRFVLFIVCILASDVVQSQNLVLGEQGCFNLRIMNPYDSAKDSLTVRHNKFLINLGVSISVLDSSTVTVRTQPIPDTLWGELDFLMVRKDSLLSNQISPLSGTLSFGCTSPVPQIVTTQEVTDQGNFDIPFSFDNSTESTFEMRIAGKGFFPISPIDTNNKAPLPKLDDPSMRTVKILSASTRELDLLIATGVSTLAGSKNMTISNFDGRSSSVSFVMKTTNNPMLRKPAQAKRYKISNDTDMSIIASNPQNIDRFIFTKGDGSEIQTSGIRIKSVDASKKVVTLQIYFDEARQLSQTGANISVRTRNGDVLQQGAFTSFFYVQQMPNQIYLKPISCYGGDELHRWSLTSPIDILSPGQTYSLVAKSGKDTIWNVTYNPSVPDLEFDKVIVSADGYGSWSLFDQDDEEVGVSGTLEVRSVPSIGNVEWINSVDSLASLFGQDTLYATGWDQGYKVKMNIHGLSTQDECRKFLDSLNFEGFEKNSRGTIESFADGVFDVSVDVMIPVGISPRRLYDLRVNNGDRTPPIPVKSVYVKTFSSPASPFRSKGFIVLHMPGGETIPLDSANGLKYAEVNYSAERGQGIPRLAFNSSDLHSGTQHLNIDVKVMNDSGRIVWESPVIHQDVAPAQLGEQQLDMGGVDIGEWYTMEIIVNHDFREYSPVVTGEGPLYDVKIRFRGKSYKVRYEASIPFQQVSFVIEDTLRASPFALGFNVVYDFRRDDNPFQRTSWSVGYGIYLADITSLLSKQRLALAVVPLGMFRPLSEFQFGIGFGPGVDISFSNNAGKTRGFATFVIQLNYSPH